MSKQDGVAGPGGPIARLDPPVETWLGITAFVVMLAAMIVLSLVFGK